MSGKFLTGRQSKVARLFEECIRDRLRVEVELDNKEVLMGMLTSYELSINQCIIVLSVPDRNPTNEFIINFGKVVRVRIPRKMLNVNRENQ